VRAGLRLGWVVRVASIWCGADNESRLRTYWFEALGAAVGSGVTEEHPVLTSNAGSGLVDCHISRLGEESWSNLSA